jgi:SpoIIAA-like
MSLGYDIYADIGLLYIRGQGVITQRERMGAMMAWLRDPQYESCRDALIDLAGVKTTPRVAELRELVAMLKQEMPARGPRRLAVVTSKPITFIVARTFEHLVGSGGLPLEVKVFMNLRRAWAWLRPDTPPFQLR